MTLWLKPKEEAEEKEGGREEEKNVVHTGKFYYILLSIQLDKWWHEVAYMEARSPLPYMNMGGPGPYGDDVWPPVPNSQITRAGILMHYTIKFWQFIYR